MPGGSEVWIKEFLDGVEGGHSGQTMALVEAVRSQRSSSAAFGVTKLGVLELKTALDGESSAAARNRTMRRWLTSKKEDVIAAWTVLGFPAPPSEDQPVAAKRPEELNTALVNGTYAHQRQPHNGCGDAAPGLQRRPVEAIGGRLGCRAVVVFDFDQTLSTRHLGVFESVENVEERSFGGAARVSMLKQMLDAVQASGASIAVVTRNSKFVVSKALQQVGILPYVVAGLIIGFEDYDDDVPKSAMVKSRVMPALGLKDESAVMLVDDDPSNIKDMQARCPTAAALQCPRTGLSERECADIVAWAERSI